MNNNLIINMLKPFIFGKLMDGVDPNTPQLENLWSIGFDILWDMVETALGQGHLGLSAEFRAPYEQHILEIKRELGLVPTV